MPVSGVEIKVNGYQPEIPPDEVTGVPLFLGPCSAGVVGQLYTLDKYTDLSVIGVGPVRDAVEDFLAKAKDGARVWVIPVTKQDNGSVSAVDDSGVTGLAELTPGEAADMKAEIVIECTKAGGDGVAQIRVSIDNGNNWELVSKTVADGVDIAIPDVGVSASFDFTAGAMVLGDTWTFTTSAPTAATTAIMDQVDNALDMGKRPEFVVIPMETDAADWATFQAQAEVMLAAKYPAWFLTQAAEPTDVSKSGLQTWKNTLVAASDGLEMPYVLVNVGYGTVSQLDGRVRPRMLTGMAAGLLSKLQVHVSVGWRGENPLSNVALPTYHTNAVASDLVDAKYMPLVRRDGRATCFDKGRTMSPSNHKFIRIEAVRTVFKALRLLHLATEPYTESPAWQTAGKQGLATADGIGVAAIVAGQKTALETMITAKPMSELDGFTITVPKDQSLATNGLYEQVTLAGIPALGKITLGINFGWAKWTAEIVATG